MAKANKKAYGELYVSLDTKLGEKDLYGLAGQRDQVGKAVHQVKVDKD